MTRNVTGLTASGQRGSLAGFTARFGHETPRSEPDQPHHAGAHHAPHQGFTCIDSIQLRILGRRSMAEGEPPLGGHAPGDQGGRGGGGARDRIL